MYFHFHLDDQGFGPLAGLFKRTAIEEMQHVELLAERILFLKGDVEMVTGHPVEKIDDPLDFELAVHGIYIKSGFAHGCFLPQVAAETGWSKEEFLSRCAAGKAGLPHDVWKDAKTEILRFTCEVVSE